MTVQNYLEYVASLMPSTETLFRSVPADKLDWKPTENSFTLGQQMAHLTGALAVYARGISSGDWGFSSMRQRLVENRYTPSVTVDEAIATLQKNHELFKKLVGALSEEQFNQENVTAPQFTTPVPRWRVAMLGVEHHINHKAELFMCLKILGVKVHTGHLYRGS
jgi:uncharacterized damage-inducible protein DinB